MRLPTMGQILGAIPGIRDFMFWIVDWLAGELKQVAPGLAGEIDAKVVEAKDKLTGKLAEEVTLPVMAELNAQVAAFIKSGVSEARPDIGDFAP